MEISEGGGREGKGEREKEGGTEGRMERENRESSRHKGKPCYFKVNKQVFERREAWGGEKA